MSEKRRHRRFKKRYTVRFGTEDLSQSGFTGDISKGGAFIVSNHLVPLDTRLHLQVQGDDGNFALFEGIVQRHRMVPPELRQVEDGGFGVRFLYPGEVIADMVDTGKPSFELHFASAQQLRDTYERELRTGGTFVATDKVLRIQDKVQISLCLDFAGETLEHEATVVYITLPQGSGRAGASVVFTDKQSLEERLKPYLQASPVPEVR
ncbi:PilZ domain-containing protein [Hyalangium rubrum]|uniref:PilZ domain-containing protein n=1 Tax=Hyalangium rubrum TaxID=3103134 RepID=A0ABU5HCS5_9BACT|nr:PilZ domain-containing protein [Hyalangium sp. s54d21]MDY7231046.1 PilZ domain-containing protein [Hyalangium sp. s54d21]